MPTPKVTQILQIASRALEGVNDEVKKGASLSPNEIEILFSLTDLVMAVRNRMIQCDLLAGLPVKDAAVKYNLSAPRISQIKRMAL